MTYQDQLKSPKWQKRRLQILERDGWKCQLCGDEEETLHVHHHTYEPGKKPWEYPDDNFITYCVVCHRIVELAKKDGMETTIVKITKKQGEFDMYVYAVMEDRSIAVLWTAPPFLHIKNVMRFRESTVKFMLEKINEL